MGILDKINAQQRRDSTKGFYFGHTEAEGENKEGLQNHDHYFEDFLNVLPQLKDEKFIFVGRKGTGKSAIAKFLKDAADKDSDSYCDLIKFNDIELEQLVQAVPSEHSAHIELLIFEWLILVRLINLFIKNESAQYTFEFKKLKDFIERNTGFTQIDKYHIVEVIEKKKLELSIEVLKHAFGSSIGKYIDTKTTKAPFYTFVNPLKEIISTVLKQNVFKSKEYFILFDDLDIKFSAENPASSDKLCNLLRAAKSLNTSLFKGTKVKVLVFLRDDIKKIIESLDSDTSKLFSSYEISLNWYDHNNFKYNENDTTLKKFVNKRIEMNFKENKIDYNQADPWSTLFNENHSFTKSTFKYILDYTFYRPRDIILFLSPLGKENWSFPLEFALVKNLLKKYLNENMKELKSELRIHLSTTDIEKLFNNIIRKISEEQIDSKEEITELIIGQFPDSKTSANILKILIEYSILVYKDNNKMYYSYRERNLDVIDLDQMTLHPCIANYYRLSF